MQYSNGKWHKEHKYEYTEAKKKKNPATLDRWKFKIILKTGIKIMHIIYHFIPIILINGTQIDYKLYKFRCKGAGTLTISSITVK